MTPAESALLSLLRTSLHGAAADFSADTDWNGVLDEARLQAVSALAAEGLKTCPRNSKRAGETQNTPRSQTSFATP